VCSVGGRAVGRHAYSLSEAHASGLLEKAVSLMQGQWDNLNKGGGTNQPAAHGNAHAPANGQRKRLYSYLVESAE